MPARDYMVLRMILDRRRIDRAADAYLSWREKWEKVAEERAKHPERAHEIEMPEY